MSESSALALYAANVDVNKQHSGDQLGQARPNELEVDHGGSARSRRNFVHSKTAFLVWHVHLLNAARFYVNHGDERAQRAVYYCYCYGE